MLKLPNRKKQAYVVERNCKGAITKQPTRIVVFKKHKNLIKELLIQKKNNVWVFDITYLRNIENFSYLSLITDVYFKKTSDSLATVSCLNA